MTPLAKLGLVAAGILGVVFLATRESSAQPPPAPPLFPPLPPFPIPPAVIPPGVPPGVPAIPRFKRSFEDLPIGAVVAVMDTNVPTPGGLGGPFPGTGARHDYIIRSREVSLDGGLWTYRGDSTSLLDRALTIRQDARIRESDIIARLS